MILMFATFLLCVIAALLLGPGNPIAETLRNASSQHPKTTIGALCLVLIGLGLAGFWPDRDGWEVDRAGYAELWYMTQTSPDVRQMARDHLKDGRITNEELDSIRLAYRRSPDIDTMRNDVVRELGN